jgi:hypothetical protein
MVLCSLKKMFPHVRWLFFVSFSPFRTTTVKLSRQEKMVILTSHDPQTRPFGLLLSLLRALNDAKMRGSSLLTHLDVSFNLVSACVS